jgi:ABC-2 type transport system permease protein
MRNIWTIAEKEFKSIFHNAIAYVFGVVMFLSLGIYFMILLQYGMQTQTYVPDMRVLLDWVLFPIFFFGVPVLTMRSISDENRTGTLELILTAPGRDAELIIGKWLVIFLFFLCSLALTLLYPILLNFLVEPGIDFSALIAVYIGLILAVGAMTAIGVLISALFKNPIASLLASLGAILLMWIIASPASNTTGFLSDLLKYLSLPEHYYGSFYYGSVSLSSVIFFISLTVFALFLGARVIESRRWK